MSNYTGRVLWLKWMLASIVTGAVSGLGLIAKMELGVLYLGLLFAVPQWLVLRKPLGGALWWITGSLAGAMLAFGIGVVIFLAVGPVGSGVGGLSLGTLVAMFPVGAILGAAQMFVLTVFYHVDGARARWWIPASAAGVWLWGICFALPVPPTLPGLPSGVPWRGIVVLTVATAAYGAVTGAALVWILRGRTAPDPAPGEDIG